MNTLKIGLLLLMAALTGCGVTAPHRNAGFADLDGLSMWDVDATVSLSIGPTLLHLASHSIEDDPQARALMRQLDGVRVKAYEIEDDPLAVAEDLGEINARLNADGWQQVILVREEGETTYVLMKMVDDKIAGLTVLTADKSEVVFVNVMGELQPEMLADTMAALDVPAPPVDV
ncbi:DUF4252 domain-containing protein [Halioglobus maricola]|nr:DUF4252 domain-containing protein [Halioglobus maricola]